MYMFYTYMYIHTCRHTFIHIHIFQGHKCIFLHLCIRTYTNACISFPPPTCIANINYYVIFGSLALGKLCTKIVYRNSVMKYLLLPMFNKIN